MPAPTDLPSGLTTFASLVTAINRRIDSLNAFLQSNFVQNPAIAAADMANFQINNLADPQADQDAVNLRTLKKYQPAGSPSSSPSPVRPVKAKGVITFGLDDDTIGANLVGKYGVIPAAFTPTQGWITVVALPTTGPSQFDILRSSDQGNTWFSIFALNGQPQFGVQVNPPAPPATLFYVVNFAGFTTGFNQGDLVRIDGLMSGGATGIVVVVSS